jgi:DNA-binding transcriptional LysR family regulator
VRIGLMAHQGLVSRRVGWTTPVCCAAPAYVARRGAPATPEDLAQHECLTYTHVPVPNVWSFDDHAGAHHAAKIVARHRANNGRMLAALAVEGMGVIFEPDFIVAPDVRAGRLVRLLPGYRPARAPIAAVYPSRRHLSAKVRTFVDFLVARFSQQQDWTLAD